LANYILIEKVENFLGLRKFLEGDSGSSGKFFDNNLGTQFDALIADIYAGASD
jgi:hypothetical protein